MLSRKYVFLGGEGRVISGILIPEGCKGISDFLACIKNKILSLLELVFISTISLRMINNRSRENFVHPYSNDLKFIILSRPSSPQDRNVTKLLQIIRYYLTYKLGNFRVSQDISHQKRVWFLVSNSLPVFVSQIYPPFHGWQWIPQWIKAKSILWWSNEVNYK